MKVFLPLSFIAWGVMLYSCNELKNLTWSEDIADIVHTKCSPCHQSESANMLRLVTYEDYKTNAGMIKYVITRGTMPPWPADPHYSQFAGQMTLNDDEKEKIILWVEHNSPRGRGEVTEPRYDNSYYGVPDLTIALAPFVQKGVAYEHYYSIILPLELPHYKRTKCIEFVPASGASLHRLVGDVWIMNDIDFEKYSSPSMIKVSREGFDKTLTDWKLKHLEAEAITEEQKSVIHYLPGSIATMYPDDVGGVDFGKKNLICLNITLNKTAADQATDSSYLNFYFKKNNRSRKVRKILLSPASRLTTGNAPQMILANDVLTVSQEYHLDRDVSILTLSPHFHGLATNFWAFAYQGSDTIPLIMIPTWLQDWQFFYTYEHPLHVPKDYDIIAQVRYDNSIKNLNNPHLPPRDMILSDVDRGLDAEVFELEIEYMDYQVGDEDIMMRSR